MIENTGFRVRQTERLQQSQLPGLGDLVGECETAVDHRHRETVQVGQKRLGEEHPLNAVPQISGGTHPVEDERVRRLGLGRVIAMGPGIEFDVRQAAPVQFLEKRPKPVGMFVVNGKWFAMAHRLVLPTPGMVSELS